MMRVAATGAATSVQPASLGSSGEVIAQPVPSASGGRAHDAGLLAGGKVPVVADSCFTLLPSALGLVSWEPGGHGAW
jgi:hypothetical protein